MTEKQKKIVYDDKKIKERIEHMERVLFPDTAAMLQQLLDERDDARKERDAARDEKRYSIKTIGSKRLTEWQGKATIYDELISYLAARKENCYNTYNKAVAKFIDKELFPFLGVVFDADEKDEDAPIAG